MALRNFWAVVKVDGKQEELASGPRSKEGGLTFKLYQRKDGEKVNPVKIRCWADGEKLHTVVEVDGQSYSYVTNR